MIQNILEQWKIKKQCKVGDLGPCLAIQAVVTRERTTRRCNIGDATEYSKQGLFPSFRMQKKMQFWSNHWISALQPTIRMPKKLYILVIVTVVWKGCSLSQYIIWASNILRPPKRPGKEEPIQERGKSTQEGTNTFGEGQKEGGTVVAGVRIAAAVTAFRLEDGQYKVILWHLVVGSFDNQLL